MLILHWLTVGLALTSFLAMALAEARLGLTLRHTTVFGPLDDGTSRSLVLIGLLCATAALAVSAWTWWDFDLTPL